MVDLLKPIKKNKILHTTISSSIFTIITIVTFIDFMDIIENNKYMWIPISIGFTAFVWAHVYYYKGEEKNNES